MESESQITPFFDISAERFVSFDGAALGLTVWQSQTDSTPEYVVVGVHGMNDYAAAFEYAGPYWAKRGVTTYAYDQRGFGRSVARGLWPKQEVMLEDLRTAVSVARQRHPEAVLSVVGISMGAAVAMTTFGLESNSVDVDRLILSGPGLRGWGGLPFLQRASLWFLSSVSPGWVVEPPKSVVRKIVPSDNRDMLIRRGKDELNLFDNRIDQIYGVVSVMDSAHNVASKLPQNTLFMYGSKDEIIPQHFIERTAPELSEHVRTAYYENGYHMLMRDLQHETVLADQLSFMRNPTAQLPSGVSPVPWAPDASR